MTIKDIVENVDTSELEETINKTTADPIMKTAIATLATIILGLTYVGAAYADKAITTYDKEDNVIHKTYVRDKDNPHTRIDYDKEKELAELVMEGQEAYQNNAWERAYKIFDKCSDMRPGSVEIDLWQLKSNYQREKHRNNEEEAKKSTTTMAKAMLMQKPGNKTLESFKFYIETGNDPDTYEENEAYQRYGADAPFQSYIQSGHQAEGYQAEKAEKAWQHFEKGKQAYQQKKYQEAITQFETATQIYPEIDKVWRLYGHSVYWSTEGTRKEKFENGLSVIKEGLIYNPKSETMIGEINHINDVLKKD